MIYTDPYDVVPLDWRSKEHSYTVTGFCNLVGTRFGQLMVYIKYENGGHTTLKYRVVIEHFLEEMWYKVQSLGVVITEEMGTSDEEGRDAARAYFKGGILAAVRLMELKWHLVKTEYEREGRRLQNTINTWTERKRE